MINAYQWAGIIKIYIGEREKRIPETTSSSFHRK